MNGIIIATYELENLMARSEDGRKIVKIDAPKDPNMLESLEDRIFDTLSTGYSSSGLKLFFKGENMINYLWRNNRFINERGVISLYVGNPLRNNYLSIIDQLPANEQSSLNQLTQKPAGRWVDVYTNRHLSRYAPQANVIEYAFADGYLTPYDMLHTGARQFVYSFNNKLPIMFKLYPTDNFIRLIFPEKVWDNEYQKFIIPKCDYDVLPDPKNQILLIY